MLINVSQASSSTACIYFSDFFAVAPEKLEDYLNELGMNSVDNIILIDASQENKPSASVA